jgi:hypothetical protein
MAFRKKAAAKLPDMPAPPLPAISAPEPEDDFEPIAPLPPAPRISPAPAKMPPAPVQKAQKAAAPPLFIKIDKYRDVLKTVQELKSFSVGLRDAMDALAEVEHELKVGMEIANKALDRFNTLLSLLDSKLIRIEGIEEADVQTPKEIDDYVKGLYDQIERIKHELRTIQ